MTEVATQLIRRSSSRQSSSMSALGGLVTAGKLGSFELKDMARYFPTLTSQMAKFGVTVASRELPCAALQIARKGTSDPAEAQTTEELLVEDPGAATIKNFKDAGVDIEAVMKDAATKGINRSRRWSRRSSSLRACRARRSRA